VCKRLGRSTDRGDAVTISWFEGPRLLDSALEWMDQTTVNGRIVRRPQVMTSGRPPMSAPRRPLSAKGRA
jgi:hypothetical protein